MVESVFLETLLLGAILLSGVQVVNDQGGYGMAVGNNGGGVGIMGPYFGSVGGGSIVKDGWSGLLFPILGLDETTTHDEFGGHTTTDDEATRSLEMGSSSLIKEFARKYPLVIIFYLFLNAYALAALVEELCKYFGYKMVEHPDFVSEDELEEAADARRLHADLSYQEEEGSSFEGGELSEDENHHHHHHRKDHNVGSVIHDNYVKQQQQQVGIPNGNDKTIGGTVHRSYNSIGAGITIAMVSVATGFACCENLIYIFFYNNHNLATEIAVLISRSLCPIHPLIAAIQSIEVCKRDLEQEKLKLGQIILPSIVIHGTFDFLIMVVAFISNLYNAGVDAAGAGENEQLHGLVAVIISFGFSIAIMVGSVYYYYVESKAQMLRLSVLDQRAGVAGSNLI
mmetsp:Transcript_15696/g.23282  ORF Transcript_15696/g.23282 Transcript_15696/m.23282 type:complete len:397 (-) Transcript_15696:79-1269(-)